ncbi:MAG: M23 family metallopeptidase [Candidatus Sericytochromatia bacterium]|nr:M23 family metallopeptidase [Candidatus Sericytochromatia bacterium]
MIKKIFTLSSIMVTFIIILVCIFYHPNKAIIKKNSLFSQTEKIKVINKNNSNFIHLNQRKYNLPFHPVKIRAIDNKIFFIDSGFLYSIDLSDLHYQIKKIQIPFKTNEIISLTIDSVDKIIFLLDKLNTIYTYDLKNKSFKVYARTLPIKNKIEPQYIDIYYSDKLYILDVAQNKIKYFAHNIIYDLKQPRVNLAETVDIYNEFSKTFILERGNILKLIFNNKLESFLIAQNTDRYSYLNIFSNNNLKNIYLSGGYNGNIISVSKDTKKVIGNYYIYENNTLLPVYDLCIIKNKMIILAGNYLVVHDKFKENEFNNLKATEKNDLLSESLNKSKLKDFIVPIDNYSSLLPTYSSVYPGSRRLYRYGVHEGIDFFSDPTGSIVVDQTTPVIAPKKGILIRIDKIYHEMSINEHQNILNSCLKSFTTSPTNINKLRGRQVWIKHNDGVITIYAHLSQVNKALSIGDQVDKGDIIGYVGNSGTTDGVYKTKSGMHLHFEIHINDSSKELEYYLGKYLTIEETMQIYRKILN